MMYGFPDKFTPENVSKYSDFLAHRNLCKLRNHVYETVVYSRAEEDYIKKLQHKVDDKQNKENTHFEINIEKYTTGKYALPKTYLSKLINELNDNGWQTNLAYGDTILYIQSKSLPPIEITGSLI